MRNRLILASVVLVICLLGLVTIAILPNGIGSPAGVQDSGGIIDANGDSLPGEMPTRTVDVRQGVRFKSPSGQRSDQIHGLVVSALVVDSSLEAIEVQSIVDGAVGLQVPGQYLIVVTAPGFLPGMARIELPADTWLEVALTSTAEIIFQVKDEAGAPLAGTPVLLRLPPESAQTGGELPTLTSLKNLPEGNPGLAEAAAALISTREIPAPADRAALLSNVAIAMAALDAIKQTKRISANRRVIELVTDEHGTALLDSLPAAAGYSWTLRSPRAFEVEPRAEIERFSGVPEKVEVDLSKPLRSLWSQEFSLENQQTRTLQGTVFHYTAVVGRLDYSILNASQVNSSIALYSSTLFRNESGQALVHSDAMEFHSSAENDGSFEFASVAPGEKKFTAFWWTDDGDMAFRSIRFVIAPGERYDLGLLTPGKGSDLTIRPVLVDETAQERSWDEIFPGEPPAKIHLVLSMKNSGVQRPINETVHDRIMSWPIDRPITLRGLPEAVYHINSEFLTDIPQSKRYSVNVNMVEAVVDTLNSASVLIAHRVKAIRSIGFLASHQAMLNDSSIDIFFLDAGGSVEKKGSILRSGATSSEVGPYQVSREQLFYWISVRPVRGTQPANLHASGWIEEDHHGELPVTLLPGITINGAVSDSLKDQLQGRQLLKFLVVGWPVPARDEMPHLTARVGNDGRFTLLSVPPNSVLVEQISGLQIIVGSADQEIVLGK